MVFGNDTYPRTSTEVFNQINGGIKDPRASHVFYSTSSQDPWTWCCVTEESGVPEGSAAHTIVGPEMGHCSDWHAPNKADSADLVRTRELELALFRKWMSED
jgi:hypothetical protein